uniref:C2H2-type domain-containing protein n=1 Tax=Stomoxys calcitrans TaxID=35570 RepID=A0A1I8NMD1_STOCA|nr:unnamed protein product [Stomoxys calcitrans]
MCSLSVLCPLCHQTSFSSIDALRCSLIKAANGPLACPICHELFLGLDKLTIHLFSHTHIMNANDSPKQSSGPPKTTQPAPAQPTLPATISANTSDSSNKNNSNPISKHNNHEKLKIEEEEQPPPLLYEATTMTTTPLYTNNGKKPKEITNEVNFENTHLQQQQLPMTSRTAGKKCKVSKGDAKKHNNKKSQVSLKNESTDVNDTVAAAAAATTTNAHAAVPTPLVESSMCDICEFTFRNEELRNMHVRLVHQNFVYTQPQESSLENNSPTESSQTEMDFKCHLCSKTFKMKGSLRFHFKVVHLMGLPYVNNSPKLNICDRIRHRETNKQMKTSSGINHGTTTPLAESNATSSMANHNSVYNLQPIALIPTIGGTLNSSPSLGNLSVVNISSAEFGSAAIEGSSSSLQNSNVLLVINNNSHITQSLTKDSNANALGPALNTASSSSISTTDNPKIWECDVCSKAFTTKYFLKKHKRLHTGEMPYTCEICGRTFTFQQSYHKHLLYHSDEKPHVCATCGRAFKELSTLHNHERIHSGEKPFKCDVCGKSFRQRVSFLVHTRIHTGVMPYKCELCQKSFRYKVSQRTHKCQAPLSSEETNLHNDTIDHISENFIKAFLENSTNTMQMQHSPSQNSPSSNEIAAITEKVSPPLPSNHSSSASTLNEHQALLSKAIDDIVVESCNKLGIGNRCDGFSPVQNISDGSMSPSQKLQNMRLYSPQLPTPDLNGLENDLTRFFQENMTGQQNIL